MTQYPRRSILATAIASGILGHTPSTFAKLAQRNPDAEAIECMLNDDTACAVDVWQGEFENNRQSDQVRQTYFFSLLIHGLRSLDKGKLPEATEAYETAASVLPSSNAIALDSLADATASFDSLVSLENMELYWNSSTTIESTWEGDYVSHTGQTGANTTVFALTAKETGWFNYFKTSTRSNQEVAYRVKFKPMSNSGLVVLYLGNLPTGTPVFFELSFYTNWRAYWAVYASTETGTEPLHQGAEIAVDLEEWHSIEARLKPNTVEFWLDYQYLATVSISNLNFDEVGFGAGLHQDSYSLTFTAFFDDEVIYTLR